jgi:hypothetical protein
MKNVWESSITAGMVRSMNPDEIELLIADLDDAVMAVMEDFGLDGSEEDDE